MSRHIFLSEHLCRVFRELGPDCVPAVGAASATAVAAEFDPHVIVADCDQLSEGVLEEWSRAPSLCDVPMLAVSLTRRPEEAVAPDISALAAVVYLPGLDRAQLSALLSGAQRPRGVVMPPDAALSMARSTSVTR